MEFPSERTRQVLSPIDDPFTGRPVHAQAGYLVDNGVMATTTGELAGLADTIGSAADRLCAGSGDLGPGDIGPAVTELAGHWRDGLAKLRDRLHDMSGAVRTAGANYASAEQAAENSFRIGNGK
ncbi:MAG TPA: hypothetical protein VF892_05395 [Pseudonocardiaceae bacterium]